MKRLKKLKTKLIKQILSRCALAPNLISLDEIKDCASSQGYDFLFNETKYKKKSGNDYADEFSYAATIINGEFQCCLAEYHEYECIDKNDANYGILFTIVAIAPMNEQTHQAENGFLSIQIFKNSAIYVKNNISCINNLYKTFLDEPEDESGDYFKFKQEINEKIKE